MLHTPEKDKDIRAVSGLNKCYGMLINPPPLTHPPTTLHALLFPLVDQKGCLSLESSRGVKEQPVGLLYFDIESFVVMWDTSHLANE